MSDSEGSGSRRPRGSSNALRNRVSKLFASNKREWSERHQVSTPPTTAASLDHHRLFEYFCIVGLPPESDISYVVDTIRTFSSDYGSTLNKDYNNALENYEANEKDATSMLHAVQGPSFQPHIIYTYPSALPDDLAQSVPAFCHPNGVNPRLFEKADSMNDIHHVMCGREYLDQTDRSFIFLMKVPLGPDDPNPRPMYGLCCYIEDLIDRSPTIVQGSTRTTKTPGRSLSSYKVTAPRCYCFLTRHPFFSLHFGVLHAMLDIERSHRMATFAKEIASMYIHGHPDHFSTPRGGGNNIRAGHNNSTITIPEDTQSAVPQNNSSYESDLATPSAPLLAPCTPFYSPLPGSNPPIHRRAAQHHDDFHSAPSSAVLPDISMHGDHTFNGLDTIIQQLNTNHNDDSAISRDTIHTAAAATDNNENNESAIEQQQHDSPLPKTMIHHKKRATDISEDDASFVTAPQSSGPSMEMGSWVKAVKASSSHSQQPLQDDLLGMVERELDHVLSTRTELEEEDEELLIVLDSVGGVSNIGDGHVLSMKELADTLEMTDTMAMALTASYTAAADDDDIDTINKNNNNNATRAMTGKTESINTVDDTMLRLYYDTKVPHPGQTITFNPNHSSLDSSISFHRYNISELIDDLGLRHDSHALPDMDAAHHLGGWAVSVLCRTLSLENILAYLAAAMLEQQIVVFCPNISTLTAIVLSLVPLLLPFSWQSLMLPVLPACTAQVLNSVNNTASVPLPAPSSPTAAAIPGERTLITPAPALSQLDLLEAPVPFVMGVLHKTQEIRSRCTSLIRINATKGKISNPGSLPPLPQIAALTDALTGTFSELRRLGQLHNAQARPAHVISSTEHAMAEFFLSTLQKYLKGLVADLKGYTITDVSSTAGTERVSVLLKDSFVESFPLKDRGFMKQFVETQMFSVYCDSVM